MELAEILKNESHHPRLATLTEMSSMFSSSKTKRTKITLYEYIVKALGLKPKTKTCEALLSEYNTHYADVTSSSEFMNKLQAWFQTKLIEKKQNYDDVIYIFNSKENSQNHKELLYLFYTFLEQFNDPSTDSMKTNAMDKIVSLLRNPQLVPSLLQAIIHTNNVKTRVTTLQNDIRNLLSGAVGESEDEVKLFGRVKKVAVKVSNVTGKVLKNAVARSNVISARAAMQTTMLNLNTVYQSLLFQVMTLLNEESKPVSSCKKYDTDIFENI